jgi:carboxymethylenebutenolidase
VGKFETLVMGDGTQLRAWVAMPEGTPRGGVVVLQEIFGVNSHIRSVADCFAAQGYAVVAPDLFARLEPAVELGYTADDVAKGRTLKAAAETLPAPGLLPDIEAAVAEAERRCGGGKVGVVGFCWGGLMTWRAACALDGVAAAVCYYGGGMTQADEAARTPQAPVLAHFGERDALIPLDGVQAFAARHPEVDVQVYAADHGFNCDQRGSYDESAAMAAGERTLDFFARHLG